jgi:tetratricopeptide (TPR) repeat protein
MSDALSEFSALVAEADDAGDDLSLWRRVIEFAACHSNLLEAPKVPYQLGLAWYHLPDSADRTVTCEQLFRLAVSRNPTDCYAILYLGHLLFDLGRYREALEQLVLISESAFATFDQRWRDLKRLELVVCSYLRLGLSEQAASAFERWAACFAEADETDRSLGVYELPVTIRGLAIMVSSNEA